MLFYKKWNKNINRKSEKRRRLRILQGDHRQLIKDWDKVDPKLVLVNKKYLIQIISMNRSLKNGLNNKKI